MENKMMMPANYSVMSEEEMTYTQGGDAISASISLVYSVASLAIGGLAIYNYTTGLIAGRDFMKKHKGEATGDLIDDAMDEYVAYLNSGVVHAIRGVHAGLCYVGLWPITLLVLATA